MSQYATIKAIIDQVVTTNGQKEITGALLNEVLQAMVDSLGSDYQFGGVVVPSSNVGTPDQNVFYIALQAGTYTSFGNTKVPNGITIFIWDGSWTSKILFAGDGGVFDITAYNSNTKYADLAAALGTNGANVPESLRKGGMSVKFVSNSDNKYVQYRLMNQSWSTTVSDWQGVDEAPSYNSENLIKSGGIYARMNDYSIETELRGFIDNNGVFQSVPSGGWRSSDFIPILANNLSVKYNAIGSPNANIISYYDENKNFISGVAYSDSTRKVGTLTIPDNTSFVRVSTDSYTGQMGHYFYITDYNLSSIRVLIEDNTAIKDDCSAIRAVSKIIMVTKDDFTLNGYLNSSGVVTANSDWKTTNKIPVYNYNTISLNCVIGILAYGVFWGDNNNIVGTFQTSMTPGLSTVKIPAGTYYVQLTNSFTIFSNPYAYLKLNTEIVIDYENVVRKPFAFSGKLAIFVGDSITKGFVTSSYITPNGFPKLFSDKVGMTFENNGVGGACFVGGDVQTIPSQVEEADKDADFLFIAGGVNDWQLNTNYTAFETAIRNLCTYINNNFAQTTNVIWITPINVGRTPYFKPTGELQKYRNIITEQVLENDTYQRFTILQGNKFMFPDEKGNLSLREAMFGDMVHPSELGYSWYAATLQMLLL